MKTIIAATDFSDEARFAAERAAVIAEEQCAHLSLLHVMSRSALNDARKLFQTPTDVESKLINDAGRLLSEIAAGIKSKTGLTGSTDVKVGQASAEILSAAESADLLVLGAHGGNSLHDLILGTTARRIAPNARMTILHVFNLPFEGRLRIVGASEDDIRRYRQEKQRSAERKIWELVRESHVDSDRVSYAVEGGGPSPVILAKAEELSSDLIVMGKHGQSWIEDLFLGSTTHHVLARSECDVLVVQERV